MILISLVLVAYAVLYAIAYALPQQRFLATSQVLLEENLNDKTFEPLETWLDKEQHVALYKLLANVAPGGRNVRNAAAGSVIASPSKEHPNYYYQWVRDAAITAATIVDVYANNSTTMQAGKLSHFLDTYSSLSYRIQHTDNPSGTFHDLSGLGEPKFHADGSAYTESWGRPQRDGPALRALTLMQYLQAYNASHPGLWAPNGDNWFRPLYNAAMPPDSVIKADLEYISHYWSRSGFDVWEEVDGLHFFTLMVTRRALRKGARIAAAFGDNGAARWYDFQAGEVDLFLRKFWDAEKKHLVATLESSRSGLDCSLLLGGLHGTDGDAEDHDTTFAPFSDEILVSLLALSFDQEDRFPINSVRFSLNRNGRNEEPRQLRGVGIGRYPEDVYNGYGNSPNGGNPWFLCTSASAQVLYLTASHLTMARNLTLSELNAPFYTSLLPTVSFSAGMTFSADDDIFQQVVGRLKDVADEYLAVVKRHADVEGSLSEQFDRVTGYERGAFDLTWSYGAFLQAFWARQRLLELNEGLE